jgi:hypothetical protein
VDAAVWVMQTLVDQRRVDREADAAAHRRAEEARRSRTSDRRPWPSRRPHRFVPPPVTLATVLVSSPDAAGNDIELVGAGDPR